MPVIIGRAQIVGPPADVEAPITAVELMTAASRAALADAGVAGTDIDTIGVVGGIHRHPNPGASIGADIGAPDAHTIVTTWGGNTPVAFLAELGNRITAGEVDAAVFVGGEANRTRDALRRAGKEPARSVTADVPEAELWGTSLEMGRAETVERGGEMPRNTYAVLESALRATAGLSLADARDAAAALWAGYSAAAAANPDLSIDAMSQREIRDASPTNRMVSWPYTKAMCANNRVDQAGALVICSTAVADRLHVPVEQRVHIHGTVTANDTDGFLDRARVDVVPGLDAAAAALEARWGPIDDFAHIDLYGCFPSIVQYTARALGLRADRNLTVTGGLGFMGAPLNFAAGQSLVAMVRALRDDPGSLGLVQGNGGHAAKHAFGVYSTRVPKGLPLIEHIDAARPAVAPADPNATGEATIEGITVEFDRHGPTRAVALCRLDGGGRLWANATDPDVLTAATSRELVGAPARVAAGEFSL